VHPHRPPVSGASKSTTHVIFWASEKNLTYWACETLGLATGNLVQPPDLELPRPAIVAVFPSKSKSKRKEQLIYSIHRKERSDETSLGLFVWHRRPSPRQDRVPPILLPFLAQESPIQQLRSNFLHCRSFSRFRRVGAGEQPSTKAYGRNDRTTAGREESPGQSPDLRVFKRRLVNN